MPEATLLVPGSEIFVRHGTAATAFGNASFGTAAGTDASKLEVVAFYKQQLAKRGWQAPGSYDLNANEDWTRGPCDFTLAFLGGPGDPTYPGESQYVTTYTVGVEYSHQ